MLHASLTVDPAFTVARRNTNNAAGDIFAKGSELDPITGEQVLVRVNGSGADLGTLTENGLAALRRDQVQALVAAEARVRDPAMTDVARLAGVSHQTVSRVLNEHPNVREQTRVRVRAAIAELGYRPNRAARALVTSRTQLLGIVAQSTTMFGPASLLAAFEQAAAEAGFTVSMASVRTLDRASISAAVNGHLEQRVAGIVVIAPVASAGEVIGHVPDDIPIVMIDGDPARPERLVTVDQVEGARLATQHLLDAGHQTVWHVSGPVHWFDSASRVAGWRRTLEQAGAEIPPVIEADWSAASGYRAGLMLARVPEVTAVFTANDHLALGVLRALSERGRRVPHDVSVVGFDDVPESAHFIPPLTTIRPDFAAVAQASLDMVLAQMKPGRQAIERQTVAPKLVSRESVTHPTPR